MEKILLIGIGGHFKSVIDSIENLGKYEIYGIIDLPENLGKVYQNYKVIGTDANLKEIFSQGIKNAFICIGYMGNSNIRNTVYEKLKKIGFFLPNIIDKTAVLAENVTLGEGIFIGKKAIVNTDAKIYDMAIINTGAIVEHDCCVGKFSHISIGAVLCGSVKVSENVFIGSNSTVIQCIKIGENVIIGAGSTVLKNVLKNTVRYGIVN